MKKILALLFAVILLVSIIACALATPHCHNCPDTTFTLVQRETKKKSKTYKTVNSCAHRKGKHTHTVYGSATVDKLTCNTCGNTVWDVYDYEEYYYVCGRVE